MAGHNIQAKAVLWGVVLGVEAGYWVVAAVLKARRPISWFLGVDLARGCRQGFSRLCLHLLPWPQQVSQGRAMPIVHRVDILTLGFRLKCSFVEFHLLHCENPWPAVPLLASIHLTQPSSLEQEVLQGARMQVEVFTCEPDEKVFTCEPDERKLQPLSPALPPSHG